MQPDPGTGHDRDVSEPPASPDIPSAASPDVPSAEPSVEPAPVIGASAPAPPVVPRTPRPAPTLIEVTVDQVAPDRVTVTLADGRAGVIEQPELVVGAPTQPGATLEVALLARTDPKGRALLSQRWAHRHRAWERVLAALGERTAVTGTVTKTVKGGLSVDLWGLRAFLPSSQIGEGTAASGSDLVGTDVELTVIEADRDRDRIVVSRRDRQRRERRVAEREAYAHLQKGSQVEGRVVAVLEHGVQVDLGSGVRGLVHRNELTWNRVGDVGSIAALGDEVVVKILDVNRAKRRVNLSLRQVTPDPYASVEPGQRDDAVVTSVVEYGVFARLATSGAEGLIHVSELTEQKGVRPDQLVMPGETVAVKVLDVDRSKRRISLSVLQAIWE